MNDHAPSNPTFSFTVPRLETARLLLREVRLSDFEAYARHMSDPSAMKYMGQPVDRRMSWRVFAALMGTWSITSAGWWAVEVTATRDFVGLVGAFFRETSLVTNAQGGSELEAHPDLELGWSIFQPFWRNGYAKEAAKAALDHGLAHHPSAPRAIANIHPDNVASINVSKAIGMTFDGDHDFYGEPGIRYALSRADHARIQA